MTPEESDLKRLRRRFPTAHARAVADRAVDELPGSAPMTAHIDAWIAAYLAAGGRAGK